MTKTIDFVLDTRHLPRALINHFRVIEEEVFSTNEGGSPKLDRIIDRVIDPVIWFALLSLAKWLGCDIETGRSRLHIREENDMNGNLRTAYGVMLVEYFPAVNSYGTGRSRPASTEASFYRWGYINDLLGEDADGPLQSSERASRKQGQSPSSPRDLVRSTERSPSSEQVPEMMIQTMDNAIDFCIEVRELKVASHTMPSDRRYLARRSNVYMEDIFQRHDELWKDILHDAAEILEIASNNPQPKSWENHVICVYLQRHLMPMSFKLSEWERVLKNGRIEPGGKQQNRLDNPQFDTGSALNHEGDILIMPGWAPVRRLRANISWSPRYLRQSYSVPVASFRNSVGAPGAHLSTAPRISVAPGPVHWPHVGVRGFKHQRPVSGSKHGSIEKAANGFNKRETQMSRLSDSPFAPENSRQLLPSSPPRQKIKREEY
jgi:hypothetical protein